MPSKVLLRKVKDIVMEEEIYPANNLWEDGDGGDEETSRDRMANTYSDYDD